MAVKDRKHSPAGQCPASPRGRWVQQHTKAAQQATVFLTAAAAHPPHQGHREGQGEGHQETQRETQETQTEQETQSMYFIVFICLKLQCSITPSFKCIHAHNTHETLPFIPFSSPLFSSFLQIESGELDDPRPAVQCKERLLFFGNLDTSIPSEDTWVWILYLLVCTSTIQMYEKILEYNMLHKSFAF